ncbi:hypothetical protein PGB90_001121 [Kerria lacca]
MEPTESKNRFVDSVILTQFGEYDSIKVKKSLLEPDCCDKFEIEVKVTYWGVNFADIYLRKGLIPNIKLPSVIGLECIGVVENIGSEVQLFTKGQRVLCYSGTGGLYRSVVIIHQKYCFLVPDEIEDEIAVALPANYLTAYFSLFHIGNLREGEKVLVHSCAGGVGWAITQLAKTLNNVTVVGTASNSKHEEVRKNGVTHVVNSNNYQEELRSNKITSEYVFDVIIDNIGGHNIDISLSLLNTFGRVVVIGANHIISGEKKLNFLQFMKSWWNTKNIRVVDLIINNWIVAGLNLANLIENTPEKVHDVMNIIFEMCINGKIKPRIDSVYNINEVTDAMKKLANRKNIGKVIIKI